jgi:UDP-N-acetyl-D-mannosaminuronic acid transferase (WecB/TagA/CpsF family)
MDEFYERAVANLKNETPQLRWLKVHDGYTYFEENG